MKIILMGLIAHEVDMVTEIEATLHCKNIMSLICFY